MLLLAAAGLGCVQRRLTIRSNPPGALVFIDNYELGTTPVSTDYVYYGTRKIRIIKDGFETLNVKQWIPPPWYQIFPLDFVAENILPFEIRDQRTLDFQLTPQVIVPTEQLLSRAETFAAAAGPKGSSRRPRSASPRASWPRLGCRRSRARHRYRFSPCRCRRRPVPAVKPHLTPRQAHGGLRSMIDESGC